MHQIRQHRTHLLYTHHSQVHQHFIDLLTSLTSALDHHEQGTERSSIFPGLTPYRVTTLPSICVLWWLAMLVYHLELRAAVLPNPGSGYDYFVDSSATLNESDRSSGLPGNFHGEAFGDARR
jgi:hypothetical protein